MLLNAMRSSGISIEKSNEALRLGSSKHGNALRASEDSNWVLNMYYKQQEDVLACFGEEEAQAE
jgi:hypothetical protein